MTFSLFIVTWVFLETGFSLESFTETSAEISWEGGSSEAFEYVYSDTEPDGAGESISTSAADGPSMASSS